MDTKFIDVLDGKCTELNNRPSLHLERVFSLVRRLEEHLKTNRLSESLVAQLVGELTCYVVLIPVIMPLREKIKFARAVRYETSVGVAYEVVSRLSYIPSGCAVTPNLGRLNESGVSMFYACKDDSPNSIGAVLSEVKARPGEIFNVLISETHETAEQLESDLVVIPLGIFDYYRRGVPDPFGLHLEYLGCYEYLRKHIDPEGMLAMQLADAFICDLLKRREAEGLYTVTSALSKELCSIPMIDGILYPSTLFDSYPNIVLKPSAVDKKLEHKSATSVRVLESYGYGIFRTEELAKGTVKNGQLLWDYL